MDVDSFQFTNDIWFIGVQCGNTPNNIKPYRGNTSSVSVPKTNPAEIKHLIFGFMLYEPQIGYNYTEWMRDTINYLHDSKFFPKLETIHVFYVGARIDFDELPDHYPVYGRYMEYFLLRSDPDVMERYSIGLDPDAKWIDSLNDKKALWLIGDVSTRPHKFPLLYKFYIENDLDRLNYSLTTVLQTQEGYDPLTISDSPGNYWLERIFKEVFDLELSFTELADLYHKLKREMPDDMFGELALKGIHQFDLATYCFPKDWNKATLIVMPETWFKHPLEPESFQGDGGISRRQYWENNSYPTTEKTWKAIATKKPFIGISYNDLQEKSLERLGYKTFRKYTHHPKMIDADDYLSVAEHINIAHTRITTFLDNSSSYAPGIEKDIEYNYEHHKHVIKEHWNELYQCCPVLKHVDKVKFLRLFSIPAPWHQPLDSPQSDWIMSKPGW